VDDTADAGRARHEIGTAAVVGFARVVLRRDVFSGEDGGRRIDHVPGTHFDYA
jgi:hypothetical protein